MKKQRIWPKLLTLLAVMMCMGILPLTSHASSEEWEAVEDTFTEDAIDKFFPDDSFAEVVYNDISSAIKDDTYHIDKVDICDSYGYDEILWPEPLTVDEILNENLTGDDLVLALLKNYVGSINASRKGITNIEGYKYLKNATSIDFQSNLITDLSEFTDGVVAGGFNFNSNPICKWP